MPSFEYLAFDHAKKKQKGFIEADSEANARQKLREQNCIPIELKQVTTRAKKSYFRRSIPKAELSLFTRHLAALIQSSVPVEQALQACAQQTTHRRMKQVVLTLRSRVIEGQSLSTALASAPHIFPKVYYALVAAGEVSGSLSSVLVRLAEYTEKNQRLKNQILQASIYPIVLSLVAVAVIMLLMTHVVPRVVEQFDHARQDLPWLTSLMISISDAIQAYGSLGFMVMVLILFVLNRVFKDTNRKRWLHRQLLFIPVIKNVLIRLETVRFFGTISIMNSSGVPLLDAVESAKETLANLHIKRLVDQAAKDVREGKPLSKALQAIGIFPPIAVFMLENGEHTGELDQALAYAANQQEEELASFIGIATRLLEPLMIIIFGAVVLAIVLAILLPILQLNSFTQF